MAGHENAWAEALGREQQHQAELLAALRGELGSFARECAASLTALDGCLGLLGDLAGALDAAASVDEHARAVRDVARRLRLGPAPSGDERNDRELVEELVGVLTAHIGSQLPTDPAPQAAVATLAPLATRFSALATVSEREAGAAAGELEDILTHPGPQRAL